ncbi:SepS16A [Staphylococcus aureus]|nr:SepS16A [Staphylococcus aureus]
MKEYKDEFLAAPTEIKFLLYFAKMTKKDKNKLYHFLKDTIIPALHIVAGDLSCVKMPKVWV